MYIRFTDVITVEIDFLFLYCKNSRIILNGINFTLDGVLYGVSKVLWFEFVSLELSMQRIVVHFYFY